MATPAPKVAFVLPGLGYGGAERVVCALAEDFLRYGWRPEVLTTTRAGPLAEQLQSLGVPTHCAHFGGYRDPNAIRRVRRLLRFIGPDLIHSHLAVADIFAQASRLGVPTISTVHNLQTQHGRLKRVLWGHALRRTHHVLTVSAAARAKLEPRSSEVLRPSRVEKVQARTPGRRDAARALRLRNGLSERTPLVLWIGRMNPVKDVRLLATVARMRPAVQFWAVGEGPEAHHLQGIPNVRTRPPEEDVGALLDAADLLLNTSRSEGFPQVVLEAMAWGCPVLATQVGGTPELITSGIHGQLYEAANARALSQTLDHALAHPELREAWAQAAALRVERENWTRRGMFERHLDIYQKLLKSAFPF